MHAALLLGYGASAINPYMVFAILDDMVKKGDVQLNYETAEKNYIKAVCKGLYKVMSKMGISTIRSYRGAKIFEAVGLGSEVLSTYFGTPSSSIGGVGLESIAKDYQRSMMQVLQKRSTICCLTSVSSPTVRMARSMPGIRKLSVLCSWPLVWEVMLSSRNIRVG